ncbi:hypothetical protein KGF54_000596 [Candida jiufengensis]|uniref:uncharacterized protein n=1 Tax=Candida jiufengensis TaxID=497108 RepID=UPI00222466B9|nr:uncharacterized protein KGF54_000596 [Candida jiufengensis]KAI5956977.1 hypothetical protein KGF54_000596 [Candida jiufengensis]
MAKSILKDNTIPLTQNARRVSFAPEVTMHRIEITNPNKRRKTDGGYSSPSSQSDFELSAIMSSQSNELIPLLAPDQIDQDEDDGSKPLTDSSDENDNDHEGIVIDSPRRALEIVKNLPLSDKEPEHNGETIDPARRRAIEIVKNLPLSNEEPQVELSMELTGLLKNQISNTDKLKEDTDEDADCSDDNQEEEQDMQFTGPIKIPSANFVAVDEGEQTMNITNVIRKITTNETPEETSNNNDDDGSNESENDNEINMELTDKINLPYKNNVPKPNLEDIPDEIDVDDKEEIEPNVAHNKESDVEMQDMELTEPVKAVKSTEELNQDIQNDDLTQSQPMDLTQVNTNIVRHDVDEDNNVTQTNSNDSSVQENVITTKIPLAEVTQDDIIEQEDDEFKNYLPVSLTNFLQDINVKFYTDTHFSNIDISSAETTHELATFIDYLNAKPYKDLFLLNEFIKNELQNYIKEGDKIYNEFNETITNNNTLIMKKFYINAMTTNSQSMFINFQNLKENTDLQSKKTWYIWRSTLIKNVIEEIEIQIDDLIREKQQMKDDLMELDKLNEKVLIEKNQLLNKLKKFKDVKQQLKNLSVNEINEFKESLNSQKLEIQNISSQLTTKKEKISKLDQELENLNSKKLQNQIQLNNLEFELNKIKVFTKKEINQIISNFKKISDETKLKYLNSEGASLVFLFDGMLSLTVDFIENKLSYSVVENKFYNKSLVDCIYKSPTVGDNVFEQFGAFRKFWFQLKKLDKVLHFISYKFPVEAKLVDDSIEFNIQHFNFQSLQKFKLIGSIPIFLINDFYNNVKIETSPSNPDLFKYLFQQEVI